ncbi:DUF559 domain-containing protein [Frondihabitans australicus]|uniref:DUF559 domain-containing protein n=1 Tax=Frondihabitans australicus TaxID=386892 RepID=UPI000EAEBECF
MVEAGSGKAAARVRARRRAREQGGRRGITALRQALGLARPGVRSPQETALRLLLLRRGLPEPEVNGIVRDDRGRRLGESDLIWRAVRVVVEYEGDQHRTDPAQFAKDIRRREDYAEAGWRVIRVTKSDLHDHADLLVRRVAGALAGAPWR